MLRAGNYSLVTEAGTIVKEQDSFTCGHCQQVILVKPKQKGEDVGGLCKICMSLICPVCAGKLTCDPWEKQMERIESRSRFLRSAGF